jgi:hypothetical protein
MPRERACRSVSFSVGVSRPRRSAARRVPRRARACACSPPTAGTSGSSALRQHPQGRREGRPSRRPGAAGHPDPTRCPLPPHGGRCWPQHRRRRDRGRQDDEAERPCGSYSLAGAKWSPVRRSWSAQVLGNYRRRPAGTQTKTAATAVDSSVIAASSRPTLRGRIHLARRGADAAPGGR